jgi:hypothetical protein
LTELFRKIKPFLKDGGLLWAIYPKTDQIDTDSKRETAWDCGETIGTHPVSQIAVDDVWLALRFKAE